MRSNDYKVTAKTFTDAGASRDQIITTCFCVQGVPVSREQMLKIAQILTPEADQISVSNHGRHEYTAPMD